MKITETSFEHRQLEARFIEFFAAEGYELWPEEPLIPLNDKSLLFTNSTIVPLKQFLTCDNNIPAPGICLKQTCLRTQNLRDNLNSNSPLEYLSLFTMLGILTSAANLPQLVDQATRYFLKVEDIAPQRFVIRCNDSTTFFNPYIEQFETLGFQIERNTRAEKYYKWTYGVPGVSGVGVTFAIVQSNGISMDIGNIVEVQLNDRTLGYEFGFGVETFISRKLSLQSPFRASLIVEPIKNASSSDEQVRDLLAASLAMVQAGVQPGSGRQASVLRKSMRSAVSIGRKIGLSFEELAIWLKNYSLHAPQSDTESVAYIQTIKYLHKYYQNVPTSYDRNRQLGWSQQ